MATYKIAVVGATGNVGSRVLEILAERNFPVSEAVALASAKSAGRKVSFGDKGTLVVQDLEDYDFTGIDIAFFAAGSGVSSAYAKLAVDAGAVVIDKSSYFRLFPDVPLVVPEVNSDAIAGYKQRGIIANPNCAAVPIAMVLKALTTPVSGNTSGPTDMRRIVVTTLQSASGAGKAGMDELYNQTKGRFMNEVVKPKVFSKPIAFNVLPHIGELNDENRSVEEQKVVAEIRKLLGSETLQISATCVRVPVFVGHSASVNIEFAEPVDLNVLIERLGEFEGVAVMDDPRHLKYITPLEAAGDDFVFVSRIRVDESDQRCLSLWVVTDNLRKGAALNAVQIAEELVGHYI